MAVLQYEKKLTRLGAQDMILHIAKFGNHNINVHLKSDADVKRFFLAQGYDFQLLVERCRNVVNAVPMVENLIGSSWNFQTDGSAEVSVTSVTGEEQSFQGSGTLALSSYWAQVESCCKSRDRAVLESSYVDFQSAVVQGIAGIEAYITHRVKIWNHNNPNNALIDSKQTKVSFDDKIDDWIPKMSGGKRTDKSNNDWRHYKRLRSVRDDVALHPKTMSMGVSLQQLAENINMLRAGIGGILIQLHRIFNEKIPAIIIRARYTPEVKVI
jgi:hypothetical protein